MADKLSVAQHCPQGGRLMTHQALARAPLEYCVWLWPPSTTKMWTKKSMSGEGCLPGEEQARHRSVQSSAG